MIEFLIANGADIEAIDEKGLNCLDLACIKMQYKVAVFLYHKGYLTEFKSESEYHSHMVTNTFDFDLFFRYVKEGRQEIGSMEQFYERSRLAYQEYMK